MEGGAREARRRRIIDRGLDRLAFITGDAGALPTPPPTPKQEDPRTTAASVGEDDATAFELPKHQASNQTVSSTVDNDGGKEVLPKCEASSELPGGETTDEFPRCKLGKGFPKRGGNIEAVTNAQTSDGSAELLSTSIARGSSDQVVDTAPCTAPQTSRRIFTPSRISRSIAATENIRILCAIAVALVLVLSDHSYSLGGSVVRSLINFRPLFLVLLTDVTIVIGRLLVTEGGSDDKEEDEARRTMADSVGKALEVGLVFQKALRAAFMDCSICAVIMISGLVV